MRACSLAWIGQRPPEPLTGVRIPAGPFHLEVRPVPPAETYKYAGVVERSGRVPLKIGVLGTGAVGRAVGGRLMELAHNVVFGTRDVAKTMADTKPDYMGNPPFSVWIKSHPKAKLAPFADAAVHGEVLVNATAGAATRKGLSLSRGRKLARKGPIGISSAAAFSKGMAPSLIACTTDSPGEQVQT